MTGIVWLLSSGYLRLIVIAFAVAAPASYLLLQKWLENFAFTVGIGPVYFVASLTILFLVAMLTIGYQSFRTSVSNPVDNLRME